MKTFLVALLFLAAASSQAQYYYKDIVGTKESSDIIRNYMKNKVRSVVLTSYDASNQKDDDFYVAQSFDAATRSLRTLTRSNVTNQSVLISSADANGNVIKTLDSSDRLVSTTQYFYNAAGQLNSLQTTSSDSTNDFSEGEQHLWQWENGKPKRMLRIKNRIDTTFVDFVVDEKGNVTEEQETHKKIKSQPVYYYYNENNLLTDIVRFSKRANRLLPEYMFEYSETDRVIQKITVPDNNSDYLIWRYQYDLKGLTTKEVIYNKEKKMVGKVEYQYSF